MWCYLCRILHANPLRLAKKVVAYFFSALGAERNESEAKPLNNRTDRPIMPSKLQLLPVSDDMLWLRLADERGWTCGRHSKDGEPCLEKVAGEIVEDK